MSKLACLNRDSQQTCVFKTLVDNIVPTPLAKTCDAGLICCSSKQFVIGNPLYKIPFDEVGAQAKPLKCSNRRVSTIRHNPAERFLALTSDSLSIFDLEKESVIREFHEHNGSVTDVAWHRVSNYSLATVGTDSTLRMWDVRSHPAQVSIRRVQRPFRCLQYSPDCSFIACAGETITIFDVNNTQTPVQIACGSPITQLCFNPAECLLASASEDRLVRFWDVDTGECVTQSLPFESLVYRMEFHPEGKYLIVITATYISCIKWEPFEMLSQTKRNEVASTVLDMMINKEKLMQLTSASAGDGLSSVKLTSISLTQLEKCITPSQTHSDLIIPSYDAAPLPLSPPLISAQPDSPQIQPTSVGAELPPPILPFGRPRPTRIEPTLRSHLSEVFSPLSGSDILSPSSDLSSAGDLGTAEDQMVYLPSSSPSTTTSSSGASNVRCSLSNIPASVGNDPLTKLVKKPVILAKSPTNPNNSFKLKQTRSRSCSTKSLNNANPIATSTMSRTVKNHTTVQNNASAAVRRQSHKGESDTATHSAELDEISKLSGLIKNGIKIRATVKRRKLEMTRLLNNPAISQNGNNRSDGLAAIETIVEEISRQEDAAHILANLLKSYLLRPKCYSLSLNAVFLDKIRVLFSHSNSEYPILALEFLEMIVHSFGDSIKHGLLAKNFTIGVDVSAEERFERCTKCRNGLMQVQLSASFLSDRLKPGSKQEATFKEILKQIDRILDNT
ncbi:con80 domain of katanin domain-containing protein [Ditylenchus destructor]|uniref:Con80 domain of katanin domain-containing protein n=1 Tax=Ditylenchus destructor TaxID=166010 RepID=A0AAD4MYT6_9BILA|nr:con80 domain of katanin domain-containing protein [Ditylenchus destructor]